MRGLAVSNRRHGVGWDGVREDGGGGVCRVSTGFSLYYSPSAAEEELP